MAEPKPHRILAVLAQNVLDRRHQLGLTQDALAARAGTYRAHISKVERKELDITLSTAVRLAEALGVTVGTLLSERRARN